jgi:hypothetical protein
MEIAQGVIAKNLNNKCEEGTYKVYLFLQSEIRVDYLKYID